MGFYIINYFEDKIHVDYCEELEKLERHFYFDNNTIVVETSDVLKSEDFKPQKLIDIKRVMDYYKCQEKIGYLAEEEFVKACKEQNLIPIRIEQSKESFKRLYLKTFKKNNLTIPHRPDFYILKKDVFVDVKSISENTPDLKDFFFIFYEDDLKEYNSFKTYSNKKIYFACYHIWEPDCNDFKYRDIYENSLCMIDLDTISVENEYVIKKGSRFFVKKEAFSDGLELLLK